jgi:hypothetical protein
VSCAALVGTSRAFANPSIRAWNVVVIWRIGSGPNAAEGGGSMFGDVLICADAAAIDANVANRTAKTRITLNSRGLFGSIGI